MKSGAWFAYNGDKIGQGRENAKAYLHDNPAVLAEVEDKLRRKLHVAPYNTATEEAADDK